MDHIPPAVWPNVVNRDRESRLKSLALAALAFAGLSSVAQAAPVALVAAENFYGDVAKQIGGSNVAVTSILSNPDEDPHLFEASPATARALAVAKLVILNGADYDPWMGKLLAANPVTDRTVVVVADLVHRKGGDNPHLWYDPETMPIAAKALAAQLAAIDPAHKDQYGQNLQGFLDSLQPFAQKVKAMHQKYAGTVVTATEPVAGYLADALGLKVRNREFQLAVENDAEPTAKQVAAFENDLKTRAVKVLVYNSQATEDLTKRLQTLAQASKVPVVPVTETEPPNTSYQAWMMGELDALDKALAAGAQ
jgi:zinc/manganese transport system substrate-binding protein